jgi:CheY-like chemotaxis protein/anti-sigma regulatory factor (Ser/Thr protein kinase)
MSHELRSPLNAILGFAQLMESDTPPPTTAQSASIDQILQAGWYLLELINEILDLAVIESGRLALSKEPVSLAEVILECQDMVAPHALKHGITTTFPKFDTPLIVHADRTRLKQVIINLLSNAIKYNRSGGNVSVDCAPRGIDRVRITVTDTGEGLAPDKIAQLFQSFNRLGQEAGGEEGTGIGLVVSKRLVELMNGVIGVESKVGVGSVFWIEMMATDAMETDGTPIQPDASTHAAPRNSASLHTLLYVEDNPANLKLIEHLIARRPDLCMLSAVNATIGIEIARNSQPDVILMDINLPGISGFDALKILRDDPTTSHIPVIALSANAMPRDVERGLKAGFFRYLTKPVKVNEFIHTLTEALEVATATKRPTT